MRTFVTLAPVLLILQCVCLAGSSVDLIVVSEQTAQGAKLARPTSEHPAYYLAFDAGCLDAAHRGAGVSRLAGAAIERPLRNALRSEGYEAATARSTPSLVLVFHWGCIRPEAQYRLAWEGRLDLAAPGKRVGLSEDFLIEESLEDPGLTPPDSRAAVKLAPNVRYFFVLSAYDYADLSRQRTTLLWRVKLSAPDWSHLGA